MRPFKLIIISCLGLSYKWYELIILNLYMYTGHQPNAYNLINLSFSIKYNPSGNAH